MIESNVDTLRELHQIREKLAKEEAGLSVNQRVERTRREADAILKRWGLNLKRVPPPSRTIRQAI